MQMNSALMVVCTKANPGKEAAYNAWYDEHIGIFSAYPGFKRVSRNLCTKPLGENGSASPQYITLYELEEKSEIGKFFGGPQGAAAKKQFDDSWDGLGDVLWSGWYEPVKILERENLPAGKRYMELVGSAPKAGQEAAYLDYYTDHFTKMFAYTGIKRIVYSRCFEKMAQDGINHEYFTLYDFESEASRDAFYKDPVFTSGGQEWEEKGKPAMDLQWAALYETISFKSHQ